MDISTSLNFAAEPDRVYAMLIDRQYLEQVCVASESVAYDVTVNGNATHTSRTLPAPPDAARFTGSTLTVIEDVTWGPAQADGSRSGDLSLTVQGQPVTLKGTLDLGPDSGGTTVNLDGELKVAIPLLGRKLEQSAAPAVLAGFRTQQAVGERWLA